MIKKNKNKNKNKRNTEIQKVYTSISILIFFHKVNDFNNCKNTSIKRVLHSRIEYEVYQFHDTKTQTHCHASPSRPMENRTM